MPQLSVVDQADAKDVPGDLRWDLGHLTKPKAAARFAHLFQHYLPVYSATMRQVYFDYEISLLGSGDSLVVLPDFTSYHNTMHWVPDEAVEQVPARLIPGAAMKRPGIFLQCRRKGSQRASVLPLTTGVRAMLVDALEGGPIIPIMVYNDLREMPKQRLPYLHLHRLNFDALDRHSPFELQSVRGELERRLKSLAEQPWAQVSRGE